MRHLLQWPAGAALTAAAVLWLAPMPAAGQAANTDDVRAQYARAIEYCNSVGWRFQNCVDARQVIEESCANSVAGYCDLAARIDTSGSGGSAFPGRRSSSGVTVIEPSEAPPTALSPAPATTTGTSTTVTPPAGDAGAAGATDNRNFDDVLQGLTDN